MNPSLMVAAATLPAAMFVLSSVGSSTATMTNNDSSAVRHSLAVTALAMLIATAATGNLGAVITAALAIGGVFFAMRNTWNTPIS